MTASAVAPMGTSVTVPPVQPAARLKVISLGDSRNYFLTSAAPELGVVIARSADGARMKPVSYQELEDPITGMRERRKVAKPPPTAPPAAADKELK